MTDENDATTKGLLEALAVLVERLDGEIIVEHFEVEDVARRFGGLTLDTNRDGCLRVRLRNDPRFAEETHKTVQ